MSSTKPSPKQPILNVRLIRGIDLNTYMQKKGDTRDDKARARTVK
jgi:hypothetical protein